MLLLRTQKLEHYIITWPDNLQVGCLLVIIISTKSHTLQLSHIE